MITEAAAAIRARVSAAATLQDCVKDADYVQENIAEKVDVKRRSTRRWTRRRRRTAFWRARPRRIPTSRLQRERCKGRQRCIVAHPVNPPHVVPVVEISPAPWTSPEVVKRTRALHEKVGQVPILVKKEVQGFILNRLQAALLLRSLAAGRRGLRHRSRMLDKCLKDGLGLRWSFMGPFETIDLNAPGRHPRLCRSATARCCTR